MNGRLLILFCVLGASAFAEDAPPRAVQVAEAPADVPVAGDGQVLSRSLQFRISGGDAAQRGTVAVLAEKTKDELLRLTDEKDEWKIPVAIRLYGKRGDPLPARTISMRRLVVAGVNELVLNLHLSRGIERQRFKRALTAGLLYERALNQEPDMESSRPLAVPPWLSDGLREAIAWRLGQSDRRHYEALFKRGGVFKISDVFEVNERGFKEMDGATRAAFRVSSGALVMALLEQPQGKEGFRMFLTEAAAYGGEMPGLLRKHFPELNLSENSLEKWWVLQLANKGGTGMLTDILTIRKTEDALSEALRLEIPTEEGIFHSKELAAWPELAALGESERIAAVRGAEGALVRLSYRCFPSYRPLLLEYQAVLGALAKNMTADVAQQLASLDEIRVTMVARAKRARDYLDWFEITRARETSGAFDDYLRLKERLKANPHHRKDDLSKYLDHMDRIFYREQRDNSFGMRTYPY